ncbi:unnamed protein product, partial [Didymodactylos carnosus]
MWNNNFIQIPFSTRWHFFVPQKNSIRLISSWLNSFCKNFKFALSLHLFEGIVENDDKMIVGQQLVEQDGLPVLVQCATEAKFDVKTIQQPSLENLWKLAFIKDAADKLKSYQGFLVYLRQILTSSIKQIQANQVVQKAADGLLYQHKDKDLCYKIYERLIKEDNYRVWLDKTEMYGSNMRRMAEGIENSEFVVIFLSADYKKSRYCEAEASYAHEKERVLVPLKVHEGYNPDGWLGIIVTKLTYVNFTGEKDLSSHGNLTVRKVLEESGIEGVKFAYGSNDFYHGARKKFEKFDILALQFKEDTNGKIVKNQEDYLPDIDIIIRNQRVVTIDSFSYLGCWTSRDQRPDKEIEARLTKSATAFNMHLPFYLNGKYDDPQNWNAAVGAPAWKSEDGKHTIGIGGSYGETAGNLY